MSPEKITPTEGQRLKAFIEGRWTRADGGMTALAKRAGIRRPTLYAWFRGADAPNLASLRAVATALGVRRAELVAAMDGMTFDEISEVTDAQVAALAGEVGAEVAAALAKRLPQLRGGRARGGGGSSNGGTPPRRPQPSRPR